MPYHTPFVAYETTAELHAAVSELLTALQARSKASQADTATRLIQGAAHELIQTFFTRLLVALEAAGPQPAYRETEHMVREIDDKLTHYLGWASGFFSNDRIRPAVEHYASLMLSLPVAGVATPHIAVAIPGALAEQAERVLADLEGGHAASAQEGIEVLIQVIGVALDALLVTPKKLMKFNFVVDKTLSGVISLTETLAYRSLRKLGEHLPAEHQPVLAAHLRRFVFPASEARAA